MTNLENTIHDNPLNVINKIVRIHVDGVFLLGDLHVPEASESVVIFAFCGGRTRNNPRCLQAARELRNKCIGTMVCDLMTEEEEIENEATEKYHDDAALLARRLIKVTEWMENDPETKGMRLGYFGACTGGAAALIAAARLHGEIGAVVSRGGRMDLAIQELDQVTCPTLLIVGESDTLNMEINREAMNHLICTKELKVVPGASHLFGEPGKLKEVAELSGDWFRGHLNAKAPVEQHLPSVLPIAQTPQAKTRVYPFPGESVMKSARDR